MGKELLVSDNGKNEIVDLGAEIESVLDGSDLGSIINPYVLELRGAISDAKSVAVDMSRTLHVGGITGDDNAEGTVSNKVKTLSEAVGRVPVGGVGYIYIDEDVISSGSGSISLTGKKIHIYIGDATLTIFGKGFAGDGGILSIRPKHADSVLKILSAGGVEKWDGNRLLWGDFNDVFIGDTANSLSVEFDLFVMTADFTPCRVNFCNVAFKGVGGVDLPILEENYRGGTWESSLYSCSFDNCHV